MKFLGPILLITLPFQIFGQAISEQALLGKWNLRHKESALKIKTKLTLGGNERTFEEFETWLRFKPSRELEVYFYEELTIERYKVFKDTLLVLGLTTYEVLELTDSSLVLKQTGMLPTTYFYEKEGFIDVFRRQIADSLRDEKNLEDEEEKEYFMIVEEMPTYPDGDIAAFQFISENLKYPEINKTDQVYSKVYVEFIVEPDGAINQVKLRKPANLLLEKEVKRVFQGMPHWNPGIQNGKPVRVQLVWPISIHLD